MIAISLWQPWASAVAVGSKRFETRSWRFPQAYEGQLVAIHAAKRWQGEQKERALDLREQGFDLGFEGAPPLGGIVAVGRLLKCYRAEDLYGPECRFPDRSDADKYGEYMLGYYMPGRFAWKFGKVVKVDLIPCCGQQGFWNLEQEVERAIRDQCPTLELE